MEAKDGDGGPSLRATDKSQWDVLKGKHILVTGGAGVFFSFHALSSNRIASFTFFHPHSTRLHRKPHRY